MSVSSQGIEITNRFFHAIDLLKHQRKIKSLRQVTEMYNLNYGNFYSLKKNPETFILKPELIARLSMDFSVSIEWIMLGKGNIFYSKKKD